MSSIFFIIANELNLYKQVNQDQFTFSDNSTNSGAITTEFNNKDEGFQSRIDESQDIGECEEIYNVEEYLNNEIPFFLNLEQNHNPFQIGWLESQVLLQQGLLYNNFLLYKESIIILTEAIKLNPLNIDAYIERAFAYFETNQLSLALIDYEEAKKLKPVFGEVIAKGLYSPENKIEFSKGLISGIIEGSKISTVEFVPSIFSSCRGILNGLWAFACSPIEISREMTNSAYALGEFLNRNSGKECLLCAVPELRELSLSWEKSNDNLRGERIGYIIGKYGIDIFISIGILKGINKLKALRNANTALTLESCVTEAKQAKIVEESIKRAAIREKLIAESVREGKILVKSSNVAPHVMHSKHSWGKIIELTGDIEKDFKAVLTLLEENGILAEQNFLKSQKYHQGKIVRKDYRKMINNCEVEVIFETYVETNQTFLKDAWVITK